MPMNYLKIKGTVQDLGFRKTDELSDISRKLDIGMGLLSNINNELKEVRNNTNDIKDIKVGISKLNEGQEKMLNVLEKIHDKI